VPTLQSADVLGGYADGRTGTANPKNGRFRVSELQQAYCESVAECVSAWNKDPVFGVIGIQSGL